MNAHKEKKKAKGRTLLYYSKNLSIELNIPRYSKILRLGRGKRINKRDSKRSASAGGEKIGVFDVLEAKESIAKRKV